MTVAGPSILGFLHVPKTAGTSLRKALEAHYGRDRIFADYGLGPATSDNVRSALYEGPRTQLPDRRRRLLERLLAESASRPCVLAGHISYRAYPFGELGVPVVTLLRDPVARVLSYFRHRSERDGIRWPLEALLEHEQVLNHQSRLVAGVGLEELAFVGITERYADSLRLFEANFGIKLVHLHRNAAADGPLGMRPLSAELEELIRSRNVEDHALYDAACLLFASRFAEQALTTRTPAATVAFPQRVITGDLPPPASTRQLQIESRRPAVPKASVIVLAFRWVHHIADCLRSLTTQRTSFPYEVIVVVNGATPDVREFVDDSARGIRIVRSRANRGFAGGCNLGASAATGEYLVFVNDDAVPAIDWLEEIVTFSDEKPRAGAVGGMLLFPDGTVQEAGGILWRTGAANTVGRGKLPDDREVAFARQVDYLCGCGMLVRRRAFEAAGGFDESYFPAYYEDVDLCLTIRAQGWDVWYTPAARMVHAESASTGADKATFFRANEARFKNKWLARLDCQVAPDGDRARDFAAAVSRARRSAGRLLVIDDRVPQLGLGSGYDRMRRTVEALLRRDWTLMFHPRLVPGGADLGRIGVEVVADLDELLARQDEQIDAIVVSRPGSLAAGLRVRDRYPSAALVYDCEALFSRRLERAAALAGALDAEAEAARSQAEKYREIERSIGEHVDAIVTISRDERDWFTVAGVTCPVVVIPPFPDHPSVTPEPFDVRRGAVFVAGWLAGPKSPNADGLVWFARHVLPIVRAELPWASISVTGRNPPARITALASPQLRFLGHVDDLAHAYGGARVALAPIRYGAGVKMKAVESLAHGVPTVATTIGAEGIPPRWRRCVDVADEPADFARHVIDLLTDGPAWERRRSRIMSVLAEHRFDLASVWTGILEQAIAHRRSAVRRQEERAHV